ncbi:MAG TPA: MlaD family protein [Vicinamibacterales bacterium]|nr:MlaD family protein [Vicinamibacterales bacterium]
MGRERLAAVGAFVIGGLLLFAAGLFLIGDRRMLFTDTVRVYAEFKQVAALDTGAKVRVSGADAGEVEEIRVPEGPSGRFRVRMRVRSDLRPLIRVDSIALIQNDGLVGNKFVQIQTGTEAAPAVAEGGTIQSREPFDIADLMLTMSQTLATVNTMLVEVKSGVDEALGAVTATAGDAQVLMKNLGGEVRTILGSADEVGRDLKLIVGNVRAGRGTVGKLVNDEALYASVRSMAADAEKAVATVRQASEDARAAIADLRGQNGPVRGLTGDAQQTLQAAREAMADLAETTEALKRNFFFRGFFNRRGYFDLDDVSVAQYREGALASKDRRVLRIWLDAGVLFEKDANGVERLGEGGRVRLDSAMSQFLRYPHTSPLVVEGYARDATGDARYLSSRTRAQLVRDYVLAKFKLNPNYVAVMPMGAQAPDSPSGREWNGVALALFVEKTALTD